MSEIYNRLLPYINDHEKFEEEKHKILQEFFDKQSCEKRREFLKQQQWLIDGEMRKIKNPLVRASKINSMMMDSIVKLSSMLSPSKNDR